MAINAYLTFNGNCREALDFYTDAFQTAKQPLTTYGQANPSTPDVDRNRVMHTTLNVFGGTLMLSDVPHGTPYITGNQMSLVLMTDDLAALEGVFQKLEIDGRVMLPLQETFWSKRYGYVMDRYGFGWQLSYEPVQSAETR